MFVDPSDHYRSDQYIGRMKFYEKLLYGLFVGPVNKTIERIRSGSSAKQ